MASSVESSAAGSTKSPAQLLAEQHEAHHATVEEVEDEEDLAHPPPSHGGPGESDNTAAASNGVMSAKAAGKQKATERSGVIDTQDEEAFPTLGAPSKSAAKAPGWGSKGSLKTSTSPAVSGTSTPKGAASRGPAISGISMPNKNRDHLDVDFDDINKSVTMKKVLDDAKRKHKVITSVQEMEVGRKKVLRFTAEGPQRTGVRDALLEISKAVSIEKIFKIEVSPNVSATVIGRGGANIRKLQADHGVRINIERDQPSSTGTDEKVDIVEIKGDYAGARTVFNKISSMKKEMQPKVDLPLKSIAPELYPFIASRHADEIQRLQDVHDLSIDVPQYHTWRAQPPPRAEPRPAFVPHGDSFITLSGEQEAAAQARQVLEAIAERIAQELILEELTCEQVLHPYIVGERGMDPLQFLEQTGCAIILPPGHHETDDIHIIGPEDRIEEGRNLVEQLMSQKYNRPVDIGRQFANAPRGAERHSRALAQYLQKKALEREFLSAHNSEVIFPMNPNAAPSWSVISSDQQKAVSAKNDLMKIAQAFPTSRIQLLEMDPYYHPHIEDMFAQQLQEEHGVFMIVPDEGEDDVILVYEAPSQSGPFALPRQKPSAAEQKEFERALLAAQEFLFSSIPSREIAASEMPIPRKHHDRVRRFVRNEQQNAESRFPIQFDFGETRGKRSKAQQAPESVSMRGPSQDDIEALRQKIEAFLLEVEQDEKERDYVTTCDFPEKFVKNLVGKNGANIKALRDKYDVEIQTGEAGKVSIQGPQKKADACKQEILRLGKQYEDEVSYSITVERKLHGELIGKGGETLNKLQSKVNNEVRIDFPRAPRPGDTSDHGSDAGGASQKQGSNEIRIRGPRAKADKVREELLSLAQYLQDNSHVATVSVDKEQIPSLIGKQGAELNKLREETGAAIDIPDRSAASDRVEITIKGTKAAVDKARQEIARRSKAFDSIVTKTVTVDKKWHRDLIGTGGANIQNIVTAAGGPAKSAEAVQFPKKGEDGSTLTIKGTSDVVDKITSAIQSFVEDKEGQITDTVDVPQDQHRLLIGTGGNIRKSIEQQFNVLIDIPRRDSNKTDVKIAGRPEGVAQAKEHIISLTKQPEGTTIIVPRSVHHTVADGGRIFRDLSRQGIKIDHKGQQPPRKPQADGGAGRRANNADAPLITDDPADGQVFSFDIVSQNAGSEGETGEIPWVLIGGREVTQENIAKAQKRIEEAIQRANEPKYTGYLRLADPRLHRHVIGRGGSTINSIRKQTDCDIQVPGGNKSQNNGEEITIVGSEENVRLAKDLILQEIEKGN